LVAIVGLDEYGGWWVKQSSSANAERCERSVAKYNIGVLYKMLNNLFTWACFVVFALLGNGTVPPNVTTAPPRVTSGGSSLGFF
jgi:hypothetical protein